MALKAGYKGIKKKFADAINSGQGGEPGGNTGLKYKLYKGTGTAGNSTSIDLGENPSQIVALLQLGNHASGFTLFCIGFGGGKCKACWIVPNNNAIAGNNLDYSVNDGILTISGVTDVSQRADYPDMDYIVVYV